MQASLDRLWRRMQMMVGIGRTTAPALDDGPIQTHQVRVQPDGALIDGSRVLSFFGFSSHAPVGSDVVMLFTGRDRTNPIIIGTANQIARYRNLAAGESAFHNAHAMAIVLAATGITIDGGGMPITIKNGTKARFELPIESTGEVTAMCDSEAVHLSTHKTSNVQQGGSQSGPPVPNT